jgi:hypothetical protein
MRIPCWSMRELSAIDFKMMCATPSSTKPGADRCASRRRAAACRRSEAARSAYRKRWFAT